jgi:hypothetical protein
LAGTALAAVARVAQVDLNYSGWREQVRAQVRSSGNYVYLEENRSAVHEPFRFLKVGKGHGVAKDVIERLVPYRTEAIHRSPITVHIFEVTTPARRLGSLERFEGLVRKELYERGYQFPHDHSGEDGWRRATDPFHWLRDNTDWTTLPPPFGLT